MEEEVVVVVVVEEVVAEEEEEEEEKEEEEEEEKVMRVAGGRTRDEVASAPVKSEDGVLVRCPLHMLAAGLKKAGGWGVDV